MTDHEGPCPYCGQFSHKPLHCSRITALEFGPLGEIKRVEFVTTAPVISLTGLGPALPSATSSDDSPIDANLKRPWPSVTWISYNDDGSVRSVDIKMPDGEILTMHRRPHVELTPVKS